MTPSSVAIKKYATSTMEGLNLDVEVSSLIQVAGSAVTSWLSNEDFSNLTKDITIQLSAVINNALVLNLERASIRRRQSQPTAARSPTLFRDSGLSRKRSARSRALATTLPTSPQKTICSGRTRLSSRTDRCATPQTSCTPSSTTITPT